MQDAIKILSINILTLIVEIEMPKKTSEECDHIPLDKLEAFVGHVPHLLKITQKHLWNGRFRINVWVEKWSDEYDHPSNLIEKSYFVHYHGDEIIDKTIVKEKESGKFK